MAAHKLHQGKENNGTNKKERKVGKEEGKMISGRIKRPHNATWASIKVQPF